jgi:hypothetical protein
MRRGGITSPYWYESHNQIDLSAAQELRFSFSMSSKGGGYTQVQLEIRPEDFASILEAMSVVDHQAAMEAMSLELSRQIANQPHRDNSTKKAAANSMLELAQKKYNAANFDEDEREKTIVCGVEEIINELQLKD